MSDEATRIRTHRPPSNLPSRGVRGLAGASLERSRSIATALYAGVFGDHEQIRITPPTMSFRLRCRDVAVPELGSAIGVTNRLRQTHVAIMVHGLMIDESCWTHGRNAFMNRMRRELGWAPLFVRYNTGLHISQNGRMLADRIDELVESWGTRLGRINLVGHSMGGLVVRSALSELERRNSSALNRIDRSFLLCTPSGGVEVEQLRHAIEWGVSVMGELPQRLVRSLFQRYEDDHERPLLRLTGRAAQRAARTHASSMALVQSIVSSPSPGIQDVRFGYMHEREWLAAERDGLRFMANHRAPLPPPDGVKLYAMAASLWPTAETVPSRIRNDGIVTVASVAGTTLDFDDMKLLENDRFRVFPLLPHQMAPVSPRVLHAIRDWVDREGGV